jgi:hypothetical protein
MIFLENMKCQNAKYQGCIYFLDGKGNSISLISKDYDIF